MARKAVDVLCLLQCLQATEAHQSVDYQAIHDELRGELEAQLCGRGFGQWQGQHPFVTLMQVIHGDGEEHASRAPLQGGVEDTSGVKGTGATGTGGGAESTGAMGTAAAGDRQQAQKQVGPSVSKQGRRVLGLQAQGKGPKAQGPGAHQEHKGTLGLDLGGRQRLSKPRSLGIVNGLMRGGAQHASSMLCRRPQGSMVSLQKLNSITAICVE